jgi:hypothetical protein
MDRATKTELIRLRLNPPRPVVGEKGQIIGSQSVLSSIRKLLIDAQLQVETIRSRPVRQVQKEHGEPAAA